MRRNILVGEDGGFCVAQSPDNVIISITGFNKVEVSEEEANDAVKQLKKHKDSVIFDIEARTVKQRKNKKEQE